HVRVRRAAVLGTESVPDATRDRAVGRVPEVVRAVRHDVALATELRSPERVNNVGRAKSEIHGAPDRNVDLVRRGDSVLGISEFPPPLVAGDVDVERAGRRLRLGDEDRLHRRHGDENQNDRREQRPGDLQLGAAVGLWGSTLILSPPIFENDVNQRSLDEDEYDRAEEKKTVPQKIDLAAEIGV